MQFSGLPLLVVKNDKFTEFRNEVNIITTLVPFILKPNLLLDTYAIKPRVLVYN